MRIIQNTKALWQLVGTWIAPKLPSMYPILQMYYYKSCCIMAREARWNAAPKRKIALKGQRLQLHTAKLT